MELNAIPQPTADPGPLVSRALAGDRDAFDELYRAHVGRVYALCLRMAGDPAQAEEWTQDAFVRAWEKLGSFRGQSAFSSWLYRLTVNVVLGDRRSTLRRSARVETTDDLRRFESPGQAAGPELSPHGAWPRGDPELGLDLERAIARLPPGARAALVLHDIEGYTHVEIGTMTGIAAGTVKAQLHRARKLLREMLGR